VRTHSPPRSSYHANLSSVAVISALRSSNNCRGGGFVAVDCAGSGAAHANAASRRTMPRRFARLKPSCQRKGAMRTCHVGTWVRRSLSMFDSGSSTCQQERDAYAHCNRSDAVFISKQPLPAGSLRSAAPSGAHHGKRVKPLMRNGLPQLCAVMHSAVHVSERSKRLPVTTQLECSPTSFNPILSYGLIE
jgi:hypothetical protein